MSGSIPINWGLHFFLLESKIYERKLFRVLLYIGIGVMSKCIKCNPEEAQEQPGATRNDWINVQIRSKVRNSCKENFANIFLTLTLFRLQGTSEHCKNVSTRKNEGGSVSCDGVPNFILRSWRRLRRGSWRSRAWRTRRGRMSWRAWRRWGRRRRRPPGTRGELCQGLFLAPNFRHV